MLNKTENETELISYLPMHLSFKKGIKGWVSYITMRYSKASNKYLKQYDPIVYMALESINLFQGINLKGHILKTLIQRNIVAIWV